MADASSRALRSWAALTGSIVLLSTALVPTQAGAHSQDPPQPSIHACVVGDLGAIGLPIEGLVGLVRIVDQDESCLPVEESIHWSIQGPEGRPGNDGPPGRDGRDGVKGDPGPPGPAGQDGQDGQNGQNGQDGKDGKDGKRGDDGEDGKDGVTNVLSTRQADPATVAIAGPSKTTIASQLIPAGRWVIIGKATLTLSAGGPVAGECALDTAGPGFLDAASSAVFGGIGQSFSMQRAIVFTTATVVSLACDLSGSAGAATGASIIASQAQQMSETVV